MSAISSGNPIYRRRRRVNAVMLFISGLTLLFGLFWLVWILLTLFYEGFNALAPSLFTLNTPPPGSDGGLLKDRKSTRLNSSHIPLSRMPSSA